MFSETSFRPLLGLFVHSHPVVLVGMWSCEAVRSKGHRSQTAPSCLVFVPPTNVFVLCTLNVLGKGTGPPAVHREWEGRMMPVPNVRRALLSIPED